MGTIFRTGDGLGATKIFLTGYTGHPPRGEISKVALGAEENVSWEYERDAGKAIRRLKKAGIKIIAVETGEKSIDYRKFKPRFPLAIMVGNEVEGLPPEILSQADKIISLPMYGGKESLNVGIALGVAGYYINNFRK